MNIGIGIFLPLLGTFLGTLPVLFLQREMLRKAESWLVGCASGVMVAASIWSLILPAMEQSRQMGRLSFIPAVVGICTGCIVIIQLERLICALRKKTERVCEKKESGSCEKSLGLLLLAVTLHNIPEGMAVGIGFVGAIEHGAGMTMANAMMLSVGIAIQNIPEGAIISMPLWEMGKTTKKKAVLYGILSGVVEPLFAIITILCGKLFEHIQPYMLSMAAGAMLYVVVDELIPRQKTERGGEKSAVNGTTLGFMAGFLCMLSLDVCFG